MFYLFANLFVFNIFLNVINSCDGKAEFSALLQSSVSHGPSEIILICWFAPQETCIIINVENITVYYCGNREAFFSIEEKNSIYFKCK